MGYGSYFFVAKKKLSAVCLLQSQETKTKLDNIFENIEWDKPNEVNNFMRKFDDENGNYFIDTWKFPQYRYPVDAIKITSVFDEYIRPKIKEITWFFFISSFLLTY